MLRFRAFLDQHKPFLLGAVAAGACLGAVLCGTGGKLVSVAAGTVAGVALCQWAKPPEGLTPDVMEAAVADVVQVADVTTISGQQAEAHLDSEWRELTSAARKWLMKATLHFGEMRDTPADRIVLKRWLAEQMKKEDMRDKDACRLIPTVVELMFVPTIDEVLAHAIRRSRVACAMRVLAPRTTP